MNSIARQLDEAAAIRFGREAFTTEPWTADPEAERGSVVLTFRHPVRPDHGVQVAQRGNTFEVSYWDSIPPGPAEKLFVYQEPDEANAAIGEALGFLAALFAGEVVTLRRRLGRVAKAFRGSGADSLLEFAPAEQASAAARRGIVALYDWNAGE